MNPRPPHLLLRSFPMLMATLVAVALASAAIAASTVSSGGITLDYPSHTPATPLKHCEPWNDASASVVTLTGLPEGANVTLQFMFSSGIVGSPLVYPAPIIEMGVVGGALTVPIPYPRNTMTWPYQSGTVRGIEVAVAVMVNSGGVKTKLNSKKWLVLCIPKEPPPDNPVYEGCSDGFWKNQEEWWAGTGFRTDDSFDLTFGVQSAIVPPGGGRDGNPPLVDPSLLEVLETGGGDNGENGMARQAVGALLNAASPDVNYPLTVAQVIAAVQDAYANPSSPTEGFAAAHALFEGYNTLVTILPDGTRYHCPLEARPN